MRVQIVSFRCVVKNQLGHFISSSFNQDIATTPNPEDAQVLPDLVEGLRGLRKGQKRKIYVAAERAYGFYDPQLVMEMARTKVPRGKNLKVGDSVNGDFNGEGVIPFRVVQATPKSLVLDGNHPLAGQDLVFDVEVTASRTEREDMVVTGNEKGLLC